MLGHDAVGKWNHDFHYVAEADFVILINTNDINF